MGTMPYTNKNQQNAQTVFSIILSATVLLLLYYHCCYCGYDRISLLYCCYYCYYHYIYSSGDNEATGPRRHVSAAGINKAEKLSCGAPASVPMKSAQRDRWFWQRYSLLEGHVTRIGSQWTDCLLEEKGEFCRPDEWSLSWLALWLKFILKVADNAIVRSFRSWASAKRQAGSLSCKENHRELVRIWRSFLPPFSGSCC